MEQFFNLIQQNTPVRTEFIALRLLLVEGLILALQTITGQRKNLSTAMPVPAY